MRATISTFDQETGSIRSICLHDCGSVPRFFAILKQQYGYQEAVDALIALGDLSTIAMRLNPAQGSSHSFDDPEPDVILAYHRDRGEKLKIQNSSDWSEYADYIRNEIVNVVFDGKAWKLYFHTALIEV